MEGAGGVIIQPDESKNNSSSGLGKPTNNQEDTWVLWFGLNFLT
jgi:hypothetical protein